METALDLRATAVIKEDRFSSTLRIFVSGSEVFHKCNIVNFENNLIDCEIKTDPMIITFEKRQVLNFEKGIDKIVLCTQNIYGIEKIMKISNEWEKEGISDENIGG